ncbi:MAG: hypothetical protein Q9222_005313 [Ikaeria aurantiellina]
MAVARAAKRRKLSPPDPSTQLFSAGQPGRRDPPHSAAEWDLEQGYEQRPRKQKKSNESTRLPIKTAEGLIEKLSSPEEEKSGEVDSIFSSSDESESETDETNQEEIRPEVPVQQQIIEAKEELARIGTLLGQDPEEHVGGFRKLAEIASSANPTIKKLALATQLAVYKDAIPGYRIRPLGDTDISEKISKDVRRLRSFEQALVGNYQTYIKELAKHVKASDSNDASEATASIAAVSLSCVCALLLAVPHFNFRNDLIKILIDKLSGKKRDSDFTKCLETLEKLFREDDDGNPSLDGVTQLTKMIKARDYRIDESLLNTFLHLRLLSELSSRGSQNRIDKAPDDTTTTNSKKPKREFRTKKQRKILKERKAVEKEFSEASALVNHEERERLQSETLKMVFVCYFRILKTRVPSLTGAVLEGLAKYAHLINQDFFGDLLEALKDLVSTSSSFISDDPDSENTIENKTTTTAPSSKDPLRPPLLATTTAFALLEGQDIARSATSLNLDLTFFTTHLYKSLHTYALHPDLELSSRSLRLPDPHTSYPSPSTAIDNKINLKTPSVLLLRALSSILLPRSVPPVRVAAFVKQLFICSLHLPEKSAQAVLGLLNQVMKVHGRKVAALWNTEERKGDGVFDATRGDVEGSNPFASTVWEGELLRCHYVPAVREAVKGVERVVRETK